MLEKILLIVITALIVQGMVLPVAIGHFTNESQKNKPEDPDYED